MDYKDAFEEGKKMNQLIEPEERVNVAIEILAMVQQSYEQFSIKILQFYKRYHSSVPYLLKQVNNENKIYFDMYFIMGFLQHHEACGKEHCYGTKL
ncbi:hypothetical protein FHP05_00155 [Cerasibacillus terrae]|uniref:Uncharacterized protein n=1 Tax=Cerasibacillus terrae TaxID=2498845 RepID=A0A5C8P1I5_9BACI|nr:hypothetical protein [Cerasibacillus terrae]TXL67470.1 hypothetical protein FHP05_00155 [Cerasibacillus terrae]